MNLRSLEEYMVLPYTVEIFPDNGDEPTCCYAHIVELPGTMVQAKCVASLGEKLEEAKRAWIEAALQQGRPVPEPQPMPCMVTDAYPRRDELPVL